MLFHARKMSVQRRATKTKHTEKGIKKNGPNDTPCCADQTRAGSNPDRRESKDMKKVTRARESCGSYILETKQSLLISWLAAGFELLFPADGSCHGAPGYEIKEV